MARAWLGFLLAVLLLLGLQASRTSLAGTTYSNYSAFGASLGFRADAYRTRDFSGSTSVSPSRTFTLPATGTWSISTSYHFGITVKHNNDVEYARPKGRGFQL